MLQPKFEIGDLVFYVRVSYTSVEIVCPDCVGQKKWTVSAPSGKSWEVGCNTCRYGYFSTGKVLEYGDHIQMDCCTIGSVRTDTSDQENPIRYMCIETGVGSGTVYNESELFLNIERAKEYGAQKLERVKGLRQQENLKTRKSKKGDTVFKPSKK